MASGYGVFSEANLQRDLPIFTVWIIGGLLCLLSGIGLWWMLDEMKLQSQRDAGELLNNRMYMTREFVRFWADERERDVGSWKGSEELRTITRELLALPRDHSVLVSSPAQARLRRLLSSLLVEHGFLGFTLISSDFVNLASTPDDKVAEMTDFLSYGDVLDKVFHGEAAISFSPGYSDSAFRAMYVVGPILDESGEVLAALSFRLDPRINLNLIASLTRVGSSGEVYVFDNYGRFVNESRFESQLGQLGLLAEGGSSFLKVEIRDPGGNLLEGFKPQLPPNQQPYTHAVEKAFSEGKGENLVGYRDYRGVPVVGAWIWDAKLGLGFVSEMDVDEAYQDYNATRKLVFFTFLLVIVLFIVFSGVLGKALKRTRALSDKFKRNESFLITVFESSIVALVLIDKQGIIRSFNKAAVRLFDYAPEEVLGRNVNVLMPEPYRSQHDGYLKSYLTTGTAKVIGSLREVLARKKSGSEFPIELSVSEVRFGDEIFFLGTVEDITERKHMEKALLESHDRLEMRVAKRTQELRSINEDLKNFAYIVSHDLRSPLVNLKGFSAELGACLTEMQTLLAQFWTSFDAKTRLRIGSILKEDVPEALGFINTSVSRMDNMINAVLKLSRFGRREMSLQPVNVEELVNKILASFAHQIAQHQTRVIVGTLPEVIADPLALEQIFSNLLSNAIKYLTNDRKGVIQVGAESAEHETIFHVNDNGRGIAGEDLEKIFEIFRRAGKQDVQGEGMGLAFVKTLVRRHGGIISCNSELGVGSTFIFTISKHIELEIKDS
jgi:PAS domain S-box-containing protein